MITKNRCGKSDDNQQVEEEYSVKFIVSDKYPLPKKVQRKGKWLLLDSLKIGQSFAITEAERNQAQAAKSYRQKLSGKKFVVARDHTGKLRMWREK